MVSINNNKWYYSKETDTSLESWIHIIETGKNKTEVIDFIKGHDVLMITNRSFDEVRLEVMLEDTVLAGNNNFRKLTKLIFTENYQ